MKSKIRDLKNLNSLHLNTHEQHIQKLLHINDTKFPLYRKSITELLNIQIIQNGKIIDVYHLPEEVIVKPKAKKIEIHDINGLLTETYDLVEMNLSWLENTDIDCSEIVLDLHVKV